MHAPLQLTWQVLTQAGEEVWSTSKAAPQGTWWPDLYPDLCRMAIGAPGWDIEEHVDAARVPSQCSSDQFTHRQPPWRLLQWSLEEYPRLSGAPPGTQRSLLRREDRLLLRQMGL